MTKTARSAKATAPVPKVGRIPPDPLSVHQHEEVAQQALIRAANHMRDNNLVEALANTMSAIL